jgi:hypothetical protein
MQLLQTLTEGEGRRRQHVIQHRISMCAECCFYEYTLHHSRHITLHKPQCNSAYNVHHNTVSLALAHNLSRSATAHNYFTVH